MSDKFIHFPGCMISVNVEDIAMIRWGKKEEKYIITFKEVKNNPGDFTETLGLEGNTLILEDIKDKESLQKYFKIQDKEKDLFKKLKAEKEKTFVEGNVDTNI